MLEVLFWLFVQAQNPKFAAGFAFYHAGDCAAAIKAFGESSQAGEQASTRSLYEGICLGTQRAWSAAAAHLNPYAASHSRDERAWYWLAQAELHLKNFAASREAILHAIALRENSPDFYRTLGEIELELKNHQAAYGAWKKAEELNPGDFRTTFYLGRLFFDAAVFDEAAARFRQTLKLAPRHFRAMTYLGLCSEQLNQSESAIKLYRSAIAESIAQSNPYSWAFVDLAKLLRQTGQESEAFDVLRQAEKLCPDGHVLSLLGQMLASSEPDRAEALLRRAITMDPDIADAHYRLASLLRASGKTGEAQAEMKRFQEAKESEEHNRVKVTALREGQHN